MNNTRCNSISGATKSTKSRTLGRGKGGQHNAAEASNCLNRFVSCFWWRMQLRKEGRNRPKVMIEQALGRNLCPNQCNTLKPNLIIWSAGLWGKLWVKTFIAYKVTTLFAATSCHRLQRKKARCQLLMPSQCRPSPNYELRRILEHRRNVLRTHSRFHSLKNSHQWHQT